MALADFQSLVMTLFDDPNEITTEEDCDRAIDVAAAQYSKDKPRAKKFDVPGVRSRLVPMPADFESGFSQVLGVELMKGDLPQELDPQDWETYKGLDSWYVLLKGSISETETVRVEITLRHQLDASVDTIPIDHRQAVAHWAVSVLLDKLSIATAGDGHSTLRSDSVDHGNKSSNYAARARKYRDLYFELLGIERGRIEAAGVVVDWDGTDSRGGDRLVHRRRYR